MKTFLISLLICCFATTVSAQAGYYVGGRYVMPHGVALIDPVPGFGAAIGFANHLEVSDAFQLLYRGEANTLAASYNFFDYMNPQKAPILQLFRWYSFSAGFSPAVVVGEDIKVFGGIEAAYVALATGPISDGIFYPDTYTLEGNSSSVNMFDYEDHLNGSFNYGLNLGVSTGLGAFSIVAKYYLQVGNTSSKYTASEKRGVLTNIVSLDIAFYPFYD
ncbi:MAG: hypothetical protein WBP43_15805 [Chitinophagales bacterium]|nr:hypothetical protein [Bacteroidota bacterium]